MKRESKLLREALPLYNAKRITITEVQNLESTLQIVLPFKTRNGQDLTIYAYQKPLGKKIYLTDAGRIISSLVALKVGIIMPVIQSILHEYGLRVDQNAAVIEDSNRPLGERLKVFIEAYLAMDGIARGWIATEQWKKELTDVNKQTIQSTS